MKKPVSSDPDQRRHDTRVSRIQSGLPPEDEIEKEPEDLAKRRERLARKRKKASETTSSKEES